MKGIVYMRTIMSLFLSTLIAACVPASDAAPKEKPKKERRLKRLKRAEPWCGRLTVAISGDEKLGAFSVVISTCAEKRTTCETVLDAFQAGAPGHVVRVGCEQAKG